jgi:hypothetical protein
MQVSRKARFSPFSLCFSWLIRDLARTVREPSPNEGAGVVHGGVYRDGRDQWGVLPHHLEIAPPATETVTKGGRLKQMRSMPFPTRQASDELASAIPSSRPPPTFKHIRKNSKVAQFLGIAGAPETARDAVNAADPFGLMSPPILPMEVDPFSTPLGATIVGCGVPTIQMQTTHPTPTPQHVFRPMQSMPSLSVPADRRAPRAHASQSTSDFHVTVDTAARRAPRRTGYVPAGAHPSRSLSNPPPAVSVHDHYSPAQPLQPSRVVDLESKSRHGLISTHTTHPGPQLVRDAAVTYRGRHQNMHDHARTAAPTLRKARSSVVLSNTHLPPLYAPKPVKALQRPSAETLQILVESARTTANVRNGVAAAPHAVWPPAPVLRPLRIVNPEGDAYRFAAIEAEKSHRKIKEERALVERVRNVGDREAPRRERDSEPQRSRHHRRAATEGPRRRKREVEYRTMADYGYNPTDQKWVGAL